MKLTKEELIIQRLILGIGIFFLIGSCNFFSRFLIEPSYFYGVGWFILSIISMSLIIYREERLEKFAKSKDEVKKK